MCDRGSVVTEVSVECMGGMSGSLALHDKVPQSMSHLSSPGEVSEGAQAGDSTGQ